MKIELSSLINRPIADVWRLVADEFDGIAGWARSVKTSPAIADSELVGDAPVAGRYCTFTDDPDGFAAREVISDYDRQEWSLRWDVDFVAAPGALPMKRNHVNIHLRAVSDTETELRWLMTPELKFPALMLYPMVWLGLKNAFTGLLDELKVHAEAGA